MFTSNVSMLASLYQLSHGKNGVNLSSIPLGEFSKHFTILKLCPESKISSFFRISVILEKHQFISFDAVYS